MTKPKQFTTPTRVKRKADLDITMPQSYKKTPIVNK